jgi:tetratricopeptide (TPR) repeat protein
MEMNRKLTDWVVIVVVFSLLPAAGQRHYEEGLRLQAKGDHVHAVWTFGMAIQQTASPSADLFFARGVSYMALQNYAPAKADFEQAIRLKPNFADAKTKLQEVRHALGMGANPRHGQSMYGNFKAVLDRSGLSLTDHPSYTEQYVASRALLFCGLMTDGNLTKLTQEIAFPPVRWAERPKDRPRLEAAILMTDTPALCPGNQRTADQWLRTNSR